MLQALKTVLSPRARLKKALGDFDLPVFPAVISAALSDLRGLDPNLGEIGRALAQDPGVTVSVLKLVNSAAFGLRQPVDAVPRAAALLGRARLEAALIAVGVRTALPQKRAQGYDPGAFWKEASQRAQLAGEFAERLHPATRAETVTAALLQDMALPALAHTKGSVYGPLLEEWKAYGGSFAAKEKAHSDLAHDEIGGWMGEAWELPGALQAAIADHHVDPANQSALPAAALVSDFRGPADADGKERVIEKAKDAFGLDKDAAVLIIDGVFEPI